MRIWHSVCVDGLRCCCCRRRCWQVWRGCCSQVLDSNQAARKTEQRCSISTPFYTCPKQAWMMEQGCSYLTLSHTPPPADTDVGSTGNYVYDEVYLTRNLACGTGNWR